jgi:hypothetical protein
MDINLIPLMESKLARLVWFVNYIIAL